MKQLILAAALCLTCISFGCNRTIEAEEAKTEKGAAASLHTTNAALDNIFARKSVRAYELKAVEQEKITLLAKAAMAAPSGSDKRPWEIIMVTDKTVIENLAKAVPVSIAAKAPLVAVIASDENASRFWVVDACIAAENLLLAAESLGLGAVWTGVYPDESRMANVQTVLGMPKNVKPIALVPVGYPKGKFEPKNKFDEKKLHFNKW